MARAIVPDDHNLHIAYKSNNRGQLGSTQSTHSVLRVSKISKVHQTKKITSAKLPCNSGTSRLSISTVRVDRINKRKRQSLKTQLRKLGTIKSIPIIIFLSAK